MAVKLIVRSAACAVQPGSADWKETQLLMDEGLSLKDAGKRVYQAKPPKQRRAEGLAAGRRITRRLVRTATHSRSLPPRNLQLRFSGRTIRRPRGHRPTRRVSSRDGPARPEPDPFVARQGGGFVRVLWGRR
jgi:hypothetical protein